MADHHLRFLGPHMCIQMVPGGQYALECSEMHCLQMHFVHQAPAECACAALKNQDGGRPWKRWIKYKFSILDPEACNYNYIVEN
jgi:hypothetical protein